MANKSGEYWGMFYQKCDFSTVENAQSLFEFLAQQDALFLPARFDKCEPLRKEFDPNNLDEPIEMLCGPRKTGGHIDLRSPKFRFLLDLGWADTNRMDRWAIYGSVKLFERQERTERLVEFVARLAEFANCQFGSVGLEEDWSAKNWIVTKEIDKNTGKEIGTSETKYGLSLETGLLGVHWITILGSMLVEHFGGLDRMQQLDVFRCRPLATGGVLLQLRQSPTELAQPERLAHDRRIVDALGYEYFFDIAKPERSATPIPGLTGPEPDKEP